MAFYVAAIIFICFVLLFLWMRWRMKASKGRFALAVVSTLFTCMITGLSAMSTSLPTSIASKISQGLGLGSIESGTPSVFVLALTLVTMVCIYRFGITAIKAWDAPARVSEVDLAEKYLENDLAALTFEQFKLLLRGQKDRLASDTATNWKEKASELPRPIAAKDLLKDLLVSAVSEIRIDEEGWRDEGNYWVGNILGPKPEDNRPVIAFVCRSKPDRDELKDKIDALLAKYSSVEDADFFAIYLSKTTDKSPHQRIRVSNKDVDVFSSRQLVLKGLDLRSYAQEIIDTFEKTRIGGTTATLKGSFVELKVTAPSSVWGAETLSPKLTQWVSGDSNDHVALTGEYGQGKSTGLLKFCYDWARRFVETGLVDERVPLLIELRGQNPSDTDPLGFISPWCARYRLAPQQVLNLIKAGDAIVIFEGFDELKNAGRAYYRHQHFNALWRFAYPGTKLVFTGRPNFFLDQEEANRTLRTQESRKIGGGAYTSIWQLQKLDQSQIELACRNYDLDVKEGIISAISQSSDFLDIVSRPSMLPVVATIWRDIQNFDNESELLTGAALIEKYIQAVFSRKEAELEGDRVRHDAPQGSRYLVLPKSVRELLTVCVAWRMSGLRAKNTIPRAEIVEMVRDQYETLMEISKTEGVSPDVAEGMIEFEKRFSDDSLAERVEAIAAEICSAGLLVPDAAGGATNLRFPHKQFFEFLIAKGISIKSEKPKLLASELLDVASSETRASVRLRAEPNAVLYLVETIGPDLKRVMGLVQRLSMQVSCLQLLGINWIVSLFSSWNSGGNTGHYRGLTQFKMEIFESLDVATRKDVASKYTALLGISGLLIGMLAVAFGFGEVNQLSELTVSSSVVLSILTGVSFVTLRFVFDFDQTSVGFHFLRVAWSKANQIPTSRQNELRLAYTSFVKGKVEYNHTVDFPNNFDQFLHPAKDFGVSAHRL